VTVTAPPEAPRTAGIQDPPVDAQAALIEEARRRARRRRQAYAAAALLAAAAGTVAFLSFHHGGGGAGEPAADSDSPNKAISRVSPVARGGQLTILAPHGPGVASPSGWYDLSTLVRGRLHRFIRCPYRAEWCGEMLSVAWPRDGKRLAFSVTSLGGPALFNGVHIVSLRTGQDRWHLTSGPNPVDLEWSPDGSKLAFASAGSIYVMGAESFWERRVASRSSKLFGSSPSWSPRGTRLVFAERRNHHSSIYLIDLGGSHRRLLAGSIASSGATAPAWSPDGSKIAYLSSCGGIKLITPNGKDVTPGRSHSPCKTIGLAGSPVWSPDGQKIAMFAAHAFTPGTYVMDADGGHLTRLTSADGRAQSYVQTADASWQPHPKT
jgi:Tol biopolymer transport system component